MTSKSGNEVFSKCTLKMFAKHLVQSVDKEEYHIDTIAGKNQKRVLDLVDHHWSSRFMLSNNIVLRKQSGKSQLMDDVEEGIERRVAYVFGSTCS